MMLKKIQALFFITILPLFYLTAFSQTKQNYDLSPDSKPQAGVPKGEILKLRFERSQIFPGTIRDYWIYIPAQYSPEKPACLYISQDGIKFEAPTVFDNLIHKKEMPITIGVFIMHGRVRAADEKTALDRFNRSYEYDGLGDNYARFLLEEILPEVEKQKASDGRQIRLSKDGNDRAIGGSSSGAIAAFTAAWERPREFSRVFSAIGTYVGIRGGEIYPTLIRKFEPKPLRIFLQDGENDLNIYAGDWWLANQLMERALNFAGYQVQHVWGDDGHNNNHATAIFPDAMRWLWKDYPQPIKAGQSKNETLSNLLIPGEDWQLVAEGYKFTEGPATNSKGEVFFNDVPDSKTYKISLDGKVTPFLADSKGGDGQAFAPNGKLYAVATKEQKILAYDEQGKPQIIAKGFRGNDLVVAHNGNVYATNPPPNNSIEPSKIWLIKPNGEKLVVDTGLKFSNGITLSPDQTLLYVADSQSHWVYSFQIALDGLLHNKQRFYWLYSPDTSDSSGPDGVRVDREGRLYTATAMGIQVSDQAGKVQCIIPTPNGRVANFTFGGNCFDTLFVMSGDRVYKRKLKVTGALSWDKPIKPAAPSL